MRARRDRPHPVPVARAIRCTRRGASAPRRSGSTRSRAVDLPAAALVLAQGAGRLIRTRNDRGVVAVLDSRLANRDYRTQLLTAMPPFRRSVDLDEACDFLKDAARRVPKSRRVATRVGRAPPVTEAEVLASLSPKELTKIRNGVSCPECGAEPGARCHDENGWTMAFPHDARTSAAHDA